MPLAAEMLQVLIVGGGPVGLFLACCLSSKGIPCRVLERRRKLDDHSRAIGVHPVSLELLDQLGLAASFIEAGVAIKGGQAFTAARQPLGALSFESCPEPYRFVLALPQPRTEQLLQERLRQLDPAALLPGAEVEGVEPGADAVRVTFRGPDGGTQNIEARYVVGCDGKDSLIRRSAGISFEGSAYADTYLMGDLADETGMGEQAAIFLHQDGVVESFPLPGGVRRWVVGTGTRRFASQEPSLLRSELARAVAHRTGYELGQAECSMISAFGVEHWVAATLASGRFLLAGDAAHVTSPIGGQGMNMGWQTAWRLAAALDAVCQQGADPDATFAAYSARARRLARRVIRRAGFYMMLGRRRRRPQLRNQALRVALRSPLQGPMARMFTMRGL